MIGQAKPASVIVLLASIAIKVVLFLLRCSAWVSAALSIRKILHQSGH